MNVAVVILNWNGKALLKQFLPQVIAFSKEATIYVADNASTDGSVAFISETFPEVNVIQNATNGGYAKGYNDALKQLQEDIFVLLNSDVLVTKNWLTPIIKGFEKNSNIVAAQPKILDYNRKEYFEYAGAAGGFIDLFGYPYCRGRIFDTLEKDMGQYNDTRPIFWASGACLFIRNKDFQEAGGFDEDYFAHQEEIDLCWRLQNKGKQIYYFGTSTVYHVGGATLKNSNPKKTFLNFRNTLLSLLKNASGSKVYFILFFRLILDALAAFQFLLKGKLNHIFALLKAHISFYSLFFKFLKKRKIHASKQHYYHKKSIVWSYFVLNKKHFNDL